MLERFNDMRGKEAIDEAIAILDNVSTGHAELPAYITIPDLDMHEGGAVVVYTVEEAQQVKNGIIKAFKKENTES